MADEEAQRLVDSGLFGDMAYAIPEPMDHEKVTKKRRLSIHGDIKQLIRTTRTETYTAPKATIYNLIHRNLLVRNVNSAKLKSGHEAIRLT